MKLFRRGQVYLAYASLDSAFTFDAATGELSRDRPAAELMQPDPREWRIVHDDEPIPVKLAELLIVKLRPRD